MSTTTIYHLDEQTGEFLRAGQARLDPVNQEPMIPRLATADEPLEPGTNEACCYRDAAGGAATRHGQGTWQLVPDHRGTTYWLEDGSEHTIEELGIEPPVDALDEPPPPTLDELRDQAHARVRSGYADTLAPVRDPYPAAERETWYRQENEARAYQAAIDASETPPACPLLQCIADKRGLAIDELVTRVQNKVSTYQQIAGDATGIRQKLEEDIVVAYDAADREALEAVAWPGGT